MGMAEDSPHTGSAELAESMGYRIITDATADLSSEMLCKFPSVNRVPMEVTLDDDRYLYGEPDALTADRFYKRLRAGSYGSTSQISPASYEEFWRPYLASGEDILYLCFSSGMSGTLQSAGIAAEDLRREYPERKLRILDTLGASIGEGLLVYEAAEKQAQGMPLEELCTWIELHKLEVCHRFTVDRFEFLLHGGRVSAAQATLGTMLQIKPLLRVDEQGMLSVLQKPRGRKKAIIALLSQMEAGWKPELSRTVIVGHGGNPQLGQELSDSVSARFPEADLHIAEIGPIIGAHTGPDMMAPTYWGSNR